MKKVFFAFILTLIYSNGFSQAPGKITCQAIVRDAQNELLTYRNVGIEITITAGSETGHVVFKETHEAVTNSHGLINLEIGAGTIVTGILSAIKWNMGPFYIRTAVDPTGGDDYTLVTSSEFYAVPYALYSDFAEKVRDPLVETQTLSDILAKGDSAGNSIKGLLDPTEDGDLITLQYLLNLLALVYDTLTWIPVNDIEGNSYSSILVGNKVWMSENLRTGTFNDGTVIPLITAEVDWTALNTPGYCWYNNSLPNSYPAKEYGALYNWYTVNTENLCPSGWRVPDNSDWDELIEFFGGSLSAGAVLKENGTKHWLIPNITRGLMSSFKAMPGGYRTDDFYGQGSYGKFWSSNETSVSASNTLSLDSSSENAEMIPATKKTGLSIRCVKDVHIMHP